MENLRNFLPYLAIFAIIINAFIANVCSTVKREECQKVSNSVILKANLRYWRQKGQIGQNVFQFSR